MMWVDQNIQNNGNKRLNEVRLKAISPRTRILKILEQTEGTHLCADDIFRLLVDKGESLRFSKTSPL